MKKKGFYLFMVMLLLTINFNGKFNTKEHHHSTKVATKQPPIINLEEPPIQKEPEHPDRGSFIKQSVHRVSQNDFEIVLQWDLTHPRGQIIRSMITNHSTLGNKYNYIYTEVNGSPAARNQLKARFLAGDYPNLIICTQDWYTEFAQYGIWENFAPVIQNWAQGEIDDIPKGWWNILDFENGNGSGSNIFALPFYGQTVLPYVNTDHFKVAGLNHTHPEEDLENLTEWLAACDTLNTTGYIPFAMVGDGSSDTTYMNYMLGSTDNYISSRYAVPVPATVYPFDTPSPSNVVGGGGVNGTLSVEGFAAYLKMKGEGWVQKDVDITSGPVANTFFGNGSASMVFCGPWGPNIFESEAQGAGYNLNYTVVNMPNCSDGVRSTIIGGGITMVPKTITNATMKADAMTLAEWLLDDENQMKTVENWLNHTWRIPVRKSLKNNPWFSAYPNRTNFITHIESQNYAYAWGKQHPSWMSIHENVMMPGYYNALFAVTWNGTYTDQDYTDFAQNALDAMALDIETNYLPYTAGSTISINGDAGFSGFPGFGTIESPYLIKGFDITSSSGNLIEILSTRAHFIITDCTLNGLITTGNGIYLDNVTHGTIVNNTIFNNGWSGVNVARRSDFNIVANNTIFDNSEDGIRLGEGTPSHNNTLYNNTIYNNGWRGITLEFSNDNKIDDNTIYDNGGNGIELANSNNITISNNTVYNNAKNNGNGITLEDSHDNLIVNNTAYSNGIWVTGPYSDGIRLTSSNNNTLDHNTVYNNAQAGIDILSSNYNTIVSNTAYDNSENGFNIIDSNSTPSNPVARNIAFNNGWSGIGLGAAINFTITDNTVYKNTQDGITLKDYTGLYPQGSCFNNTVTDNTIFDNSGDGIHIESSVFNTINDNTVYNSGFAEINLRQSSNNTVSSNTVHDNRAAGGIYIVKNDYYNTISNNNVYNNSHGIRLEAEADKNSIMNNIVYDNGAGIHLEFSKNNTITSNIVRDNGVGITIVNGDELGDSRYNTISQNLIYDNQGYGVVLMSMSGQNQIKTNDFHENNAGESQATDGGSYNVFSSNYWNDWTGTGLYAIHGSVGNADTSPSVNSHHLSAPVITAPTSVTLKDSVTLQWTASTDTFGHSFTYSVYYSTDGGSSWIKIASDWNTLSHTWDVTSLYDGTTVLLKVEVIDSIGYRSYSISTNEYKIDNPGLISTTTTTPTTTTTTPSTTTEPTLTVGTPGMTILVLLQSIPVLLVIKRKRRT